MNVEGSKTAWAVIDVSSMTILNGMPGIICDKGDPFSEVTIGTVGDTLGVAGAVCIEAGSVFNIACGVAGAVDGNIGAEIGEFVETIGDSTSTAGVCIGGEFMSLITILKGIFCIIGTKLGTIGVGAFAKGVLGVPLDENIPTLVVSGANSGATDVMSAGITV